MSSPLWLHAVRNAASDVRECSSGRRKLWTAQHVGTREIARNGGAAREKRKREVKDDDSRSAIGAYRARAVICVKARFRTALYVHAVTFIPADRAGDQSRGRVVSHHNGCAAVGCVVRYARDVGREIGSRVRHDRRTLIAAEGVTVAENLTASID